MPTLMSRCCSESFSHIWVPSGAFGYVHTMSLPNAVCSGSGARPVPLHLPVI